MGILRSVALRANKVSRDTRDHHARSLRGGVIALMPGEPMLTARLAELLGVAPGERAGADLLVIPLAPGDSAEFASSEVVARSREDRRTLVVVVGPVAERARREADLLADPDVTIGDLAFAPDAQSDRSVALIMDGVIRALGHEMVSAARRHPSLRAAVRRHLVDVAAREAAAAGALNWFSGAAAAQHAMVVRIGSSEGRAMGVARIPEIVAATGVGLVTGVVARGASRIVPAPRWVVRGAVAWASTVALAAATERIARHVGEGTDPVSALKGFVAARFGRKGEV